MPIDYNCQSCVPIGAQFDYSDQGYAMVDQDNEVDDPNQQVCFYYDVSGDPSNPNPSYIPLPSAGYGADLSSKGSGTIIVVPQGSCGGQTIQITNITNLWLPDCVGLTDPHTCANPSFISLFGHEENGAPIGNDIAVIGRALQDGTDISDQISWTCISTPNPPDNPNAYTDGGPCYLGNPAIATGATITFIPNPPAAPTGRTAPLSYEITAQINITGVPIQDTKIITQDKLDELRQEYEDFPECLRQPRTNFDKDPPAYPGLIGTAAEPDRFGGTTGWHILKMHNLNQHAIDTDNNYTDGDLRITSGYRTPMGNAAVGGTARSNHQYGQAFDFNQQDSEENDNVFEAAYAAGAREDSYLKASEPTDTYYPIRYFWYEARPDPSELENELGPGWAYTQGHVAWE